MNDTTFSLQRLAYFLIVVCILFYVLVIAKAILVPLAFAAVFALLLKPIADRYERWRWLSGRTTSSFLALFTLIIPILGLITFVGWQSFDMFQAFSSIGDKLIQGFDKTFIWANSQFKFTNDTSQKWLAEHIEPILSTPLGAVGSSIASTSAILVNVVLTFIYTFFLLLYRGPIKNFFLIQFGDNSRDEAHRILSDLQRVIQGYLYGLLLVIALLGVTSSIGMWIIGIDYAFFWGFLAACLALIPYVGTFVGGFLPFIYAFATSDSIWTPIWVAALFMTIQFIDNNFITPNIVGNSVKINPLAAILALIVGGTVWGVPGLILAIPFIAIIKEVIEQIPFLKPVGILLSSDLYKKEKILARRYDKDRYRLWTFFKKQEEISVEVPLENENSTPATPNPANVTTPE